MPTMRSGAAFEPSWISEICVSRFQILIDLSIGGIYNAITFFLEPRLSPFSDMKMCSTP
jgi:hypothetical protein